jgi:hypothetical protein
VRKILCSRYSCGAANVVVFACMDTEVDHVPIPVLHDTAARKCLLSPEQWEHVRTCQRCLVYLARLVDVRANIESIRQKIAAA